MAPLLVYNVLRQQKHSPRQPFRELVFGKKITLDYESLRDKCGIWASAIYQPVCQLFITVMLIIFTPLVLCYINLAGSVSCNSWLIIHSLQLSGGGPSLNLLTKLEKECRVLYSFCVCSLYSDLPPPFATLQPFTILVSYNGQIHCPSLCCYAEY